MKSFTLTDLSRACERDTLQVTFQEGSSLIQREILRFVFVKTKGAFLW
jgi:hypothetical protein